MGVVKFSIKHGITKKCHSLINPGPLPLGHAFIAKDHSEKTHKLPPPPNAIGDSDYVGILTTMTDLLNDGSKFNDGKFFPLLVAENEQEIVQNILIQFCEAAQIEVEQYVLLPITYFFEKLRLACEKFYQYKSEFKFSYAVASSHLERDIYQYHKGNGCTVHEEGEININCALSRATRNAYVILDQTCDVCEIKEKRKGFHYPPDCDIEPDYVVKKEESDDEVKKEESDDDEKTVKDEDSDNETGFSISTGAYDRLRAGRVKDEFDDASSSTTSRRDGFVNEIRTIREDFSKYRSRRRTDSESDDSGSSSGSYRHNKVRVKPDPDANEYRSSSSYRSSNDYRSSKDHRSTKDYRSSRDNHYSSRR